VVNGVTTYHIGNHFEWRSTTSNMGRYYYADGQRIAMRYGSTVYYLLGDHLGSTTLTVTGSGAKYAEQRYYPWGDTRYTYWKTPTAYQFTGQYHDTDLGLYFYNARYYDSALGRFIQADSIVPNPANPQSLNRYSYTLGNPLRYTDPTGHMTDEEIAQALGFNDVDELYASKLWMMWTSRAFGDSYWIAVLRAIQAGDRLYATERLGYLLFAKVNGKMTLSTQVGTSSRLWDWQGAGFYTIERFESNRDNARLSAAVFMGAEGFHPLYLGMGDLDQPLYCYHEGSNGEIRPEYVGYRIIDRTLGIKWTTFLSAVTGDDDWANFLDVSSDVALLHIPGIQAIGVAKTGLDALSVAYHTIKDPYHYGVEFSLTGE